MRLERYSPTKIKMTTKIAKKENLNSLIIRRKDTSTIIKMKAISRMNLESRPGNFTRIKWTQTCWWTTLSYLIVRIVLLSQTISIQMLTHRLSLWPVLKIHPNSKEPRRVSWTNLTVRRQSQNCLQPLKSCNTRNWSSNRSINQELSNSKLNKVSPKVL